MRESIIALDMVQLDELEDEIEVVETEKQTKETVDGYRRKIAAVIGAADVVPISDLSYFLFGQGQKRP